MAADPRLVALRLPAIRALNPPEHQAFLRTVRRVVNPDGTFDLSRGIGVLPDDAFPIPDSSQVADEPGSGYDTIKDRLAALGITYAPTNASYIVQAPNGTLSNEQALSVLATGLLKNATGTGVLSIAAANTDYLPVASPAMTGTATLPGNVASSGSAPSASPGAAAGTGATIDAITGNDFRTRVTITIGTVPGTGTLFTITWSATRPSAVYGIVVQGVGANGIDAVKGGIGQSGATTTTCPVITRAALTAGQQYIVSIIAIQ